ncbi:MAG: PQQ-dependent dehydrogenase, methanol/ethanol family, partial [Bacteroidota bacterium]
MKTKVILSLVILSGICSCSPEDESNAKGIPAEDLRIDEMSNTSEWLAYGRTHSEQRFSPLTDINASNVSELSPDWYMDLPNDVALVSTPLVIDRTLYFTGTMNVVRAVDATNGSLIWDYDPKVGDALQKKRRPFGWTHSRGLSYYEGKIFTATWDGRLLALDAQSGAKVWEVETVSDTSGFNITGVPKAFKGKVLIGNGGADAGPAPRGYVTAYDADTGAESWRFWIVPGNPADGFENAAMEMAAKTWSGEWWKQGGGGNAWHGITYDPALDQLYIGTGNGYPWNRYVRSPPDGSDNLFLCSIVALDPDTGDYLWHYQTTPGEMWDYNSTMDIVLADLDVNGETVKALMQAPKNGFFYVINRENGELISAEPYAETSWASHVDMATGKPAETPGADGKNGPVYLTPGTWGAHTWHAMSYNPQTGLVYLPTLHHAELFTNRVDDLAAYSGGLGAGVSHIDLQPREYPASLQAWDPITQEAQWSIPQETFWNAGTLTTGGHLVFQGRTDGIFAAYHADRGDLLWEWDAGLGISAPPITYKIDGKQYLALLVGFGGGWARGGWEAHQLGWTYQRHMRRLVVFSLEGAADVPDQPVPLVPKPLVMEDFQIDEALARIGENKYWSCFNCHGNDMFAGGMSPDLRASVMAQNKQAFTSVVRDGLLASR